MFCKNCGNEVPDNATFCTNCGESITSDANNDIISDTYSSNSNINYGNTAYNGQQTYELTRYNQYPYGYNQYPSGYNQYPYGYNQYSYGYNQYSSGQVQKYNGLCITALVTGLCGLIILGLIFGILAVIFGAIGIAKFNEQTQKGKGMGIAGLILGIIEIAYAFILFLILL